MGTPHLPLRIYLLVWGRLVGGRLVWARQVWGRQVWGASGLGGPLVWWRLVWGALWSGEPSGLQAAGLPGPPRSPGPLRVTDRPRGAQRVDSRVWLRT